MVVVDPGQTNGVASSGPGAPRPWVAPETPADPVRSDLASVGVHALATSEELAESDTEWRDRPRPGPAPRPPVALKTLTLSDIFDGAWNVLRVRPRAVFALSAMIIVPAELLGSWLVRGYGDGLGLPALVQSFFPIFKQYRGAQQASALAGIAVMSLAYAFLGVAVGHLLAAWYAGRDLSGPGAALAALKQGHVVLATSLLLALPKALSIWALVVPSIFVFPLFLLVGPVIAFERAGPLKAISRSVGLVSRRYIAVVLLWTLWLLVERVADETLRAVPGFIGTFAGDDVARILEPAGWAFALFLTAPAVAAFASLVYLDLRVRKEGLDLQILAADALR